MPLNKSGRLPEDLREALSASGLSARAVEEKTALLEQARRTLTGVQARLEPGALSAFFVPGRIEVLGKHTDYAGGSSLVAAAERGFCVLAAPRADSKLRMLDVRLEEEIQIPIAAGLETVPGNWSHYPKTVARRLARNYPGPVRGADVAFISDLPPASGLSSSSALVVATFLVLNEFNAFSRSEAYRANIKTREDLAGYLGTVENGQTFGTLAGSLGVGTFGGSEDHAAILCSIAGQLSQFAYCPVRLERRVAMPEGHAFAVAASGVVAEKTGAAAAKYNRLSQLAAGIVRKWQAATGGKEATLHAILAKSADAMKVLADVLQEESSSSSGEKDLIRRLEHFQTENVEILPAAAEALARGDLAEFGNRVDRSQAASESLLQNQVAETSFLARSARELGAPAASAFGAGFGGSVWALVKTDSASGFLRDWESAYARAFPQHRTSSAMWVTFAGPPAFSFSAGSSLES